MSGLLLLVGSMVIFFVAYVTYGSWLCKKWGVDPTRKTPAERLCDNVDYMPTKPAVLMGHHFSSIAAPVLSLVLSPLLYSVGFL